MDETYIPTEPKRYPDDVLVGFELRPFVFVADELSTSVLLMSTSVPDVEEIRISASEIGSYFGTDFITLRDDGVPPDESAADGTFSGLVQMVDPPTTFPGRGGMRLVTFELVMPDESVVQVTEDVGSSYGYIESRDSVPVTPIGGGISVSPHVVNVVDPLLIVDYYPLSLLNERACSERLYDELLGDWYDWLIFFHIYPRRGAPGGSYATRRNLIQGIGKPLEDDGASWGSDERLRGVINLNWKHVEVLSHEILHTWGIQGFEVFGMQSSVGGPSHWGPFANDRATSVFGGNYTLENLWDNFDGTFSGCKSTHNYVLPIELYLMGLIPISQIETYDYVLNSSFVDSVIDNDCTGFYRMNFLGDGLATLDGPTILNAFGPRIPAYPDVNSFRGLAIVVSDRPLYQEEWSYIDGLFESHPTDFSGAYLDMATVSYGLFDAPALIVPENGAVLDNGCTNGIDMMEWAFDWLDVDSADRYEIWIKHPSAAGPLNTPVLFQSEYLLSTDGRTDSLTGWEWRVRAGDAAVWGPWSETRLFDVEPVNTDCPEGSIIVEKQTVPDGESATFTFTGDVVGTITDGGQLVFASGAGTFSSTETVPGGWSLFEIECDDDDSVGDIATATATFDVADGETVTCAFTNCADSQSMIDLSDVTVTGTETYTACDTLTADTFRVQNTGNVRFRAGNRIVLENGFSVASGGIFAAELVGSP